MSEEYDNYLRDEWRLFKANRERFADALRFVRNRRIEHVLDVGCGAGQEMLPFISEKGAKGFGVDIAESVGRVGRELYGAENLSAKSAFFRARAEELPFENASFEVVICRVALPYMDNEKALGEMVRVLKKDGFLFLKFHHLNFYVREFVDGVKSLELKQSIHAARVMTAGGIYRIFGKQPRSRILGAESFQTREFIEKILSRSSMKYLGESVDSNSQTPSPVYVKT